MPWYPDESEPGRNRYEVASEFDKLVADWMNIPLMDVWDIDYLLYMQMRRDAFISRLRESEAGREYLDKAWLLSRTEPDRAESRRRFGGGE